MGKAVLNGEPPAPSGKLTEKLVLAATPSSKPTRLFDGRGLFLLIAPSGGKWWRFKFRFGGEQSNLALGVYPDVNLAQARERREQARLLLAQGIDPSIVRRVEKAREAADSLAAKDLSVTRVSVAIDGAVEIWKGRAVVRLTPSEAQGVHSLLSRLSV